TGEIDPEALYYCRARGISLSDARAMLLYAFAHDVVEQVKLPALRAHLDRLIEARLDWCSICDGWWQMEIRSSIHHPSSSEHEPHLPRLPHRRPRPGLLPPAGAGGRGARDELRPR